MKAGDIIMVGFWVKVDSTPKCKELREEREDWSERVFVKSEAHFGNDDHTYLSFYKKYRPKSWTPVLAKII